MNSYVEECRREWRRLGVPDSLAEEMATELETDLAEAETDGVSAAELLGESDPRLFATTWARERGLVTEPAPKKSRKWLWISLAVFLFLVLVLFPASQLIGTSGGSSSAVNVGPPVRVKAVTVPNLVGVKVCKAIRIAGRANLSVNAPEDSHCDAVVVRQKPTAGAVVPANAANAVVTVRLRRLGG